MKLKKNLCGAIVKWTLVIILVVVQVYPFVYVIFSSFKSLEDFRKLPAYALPASVYLGNYITVFTKSHMFTYFKNSIIVLIGVIIPLLLLALMAGFALSKIKFKFKKFLAFLEKIFNVGFVFGKYFINKEYKGWLYDRYYKCS